jgi:spore coat protein CotF
MYFSVYQPSQTTLLTLSGGKFAEADWQQLYEDVLCLMKNSRQAQKTMIMIAIAQNDTERPNATWRRRLAELRNQGQQIPSVLTVMVTQSLLLRGVITAMNWIVPARSNEQTTAVNSFEEAHIWLRQKTQDSLDYLIEMHKQGLSMLPKRAPM